MKVALISSYCLDSTMPLAKHLGDKNIDVHLFGILPRYNQDVYMVDFSGNKQPSGFIGSSIAAEHMGKNLCQYLSHINTRFFVYPAGAGKKSFFQDIYFAWKFSRHLIKSNFDVVHLIHTSNRFSLLLMHFLKKQNLIQTLHEVTSHEVKTPSINKRILKLLIRNSTPIIFHSDISKSRFLEFRKSVSPLKTKEDNLIVIRFGLYEIYKLYANQSIKINTPDNNKINILYFGRIEPYKGIHFLIEAIKILQNVYPIHLIVAGKGIPDFDFKDVKSFEFINRSITTTEIITLIEKCEMVVLPYISGSQSGIPMTVFSFNKPIIASNIAGFKEIIDHLKTGILVDNLNSQSVASSIEMLLVNSDLKSDMRKNIKKKYNEGEFSWSFIADKTLKFYCHQLVNNQTDLK